jgi:ribosomal protein S18 acetylase RimI-like enzyme
MQIREADCADRNEIVSLDQVARVEPERIRFIERVLSSRSCLVTTDRGQVTGYGVLEYTFYGQGFISMLCVSAAFRRHGMGRALIQALEARCTTPKIFTSTNQSNRPMQGLLATLGYCPSGVILNLDPGDPELVYVRVLREGAAQADRS